MNNTFCKTCHRIPSQCVCQPTKPVAYVNSMCSDYIDWKVDPMSIDGKSLYTHPIKELTDEEIIKQANHLADGWFSDKFEKGIFITEEKLVALVKAILRKAQEK